MSQRKEGSWISYFIFPALLVAVLWIIEGLKWMQIADLTWLGIHPQQVNGLPGIFFAPLLHGGFGHLVSNSSPLLFLLGGIFYFYPTVKWRVVFWSWLMTGVWVWVAGSPGTHIGASGLVYAFAAFIFFSSILRKSKGTFALSLLIVLLYGGLIWGLVPGLKGISWESHLFGGIAGLILSVVYRKHDIPGKKKYSWEITPETSEGDDEALWNYRKDEIIRPGDDEGE